MTWLTEQQLLLGGLHVLVPTVAMVAICLAYNDGPGEPRDAGGRPTTGHTGLYAGSALLYTLTGAYNLWLLSRDSRLPAPMKYTNSIMCWSSFFFGYAQIVTDFAPLRQILVFGEWYCVPNYGWGLEWGLQLFYEAGSGLRAAAILGASIASYFLKFAFEGGFVIAFLPQVAGAIGVCVVCYQKYKSAEAFRQLLVWVTACLFFLLLHVSEAILPPSLLEQPYWNGVHLFAVKVCDCTQIHNSIRFFVTLFRAKAELDVVAKAQPMALEQVADSP